MTIGIDVLTAPNESLVQIFFEGKELKKEALRQYVLETLQHIQQKITYYLDHPDFEKKWNDCHDQAVSKNDHATVLACDQIKDLTSKIEFWISQAVATPQAFEFFILSKATEISSGDLDKDYFYALMIRHDQLLSVIIIFLTALQHIEKLYELKVSDMLAHESFHFFVQHTFDDYIYEKAESLYQVRKQQGILA